MGVEGRMHWLVVLLPLMCGACGNEGENDRRLSVRFRQRIMPFLIKALLFPSIVARLVMAIQTLRVFSVSVADFFSFKITFSVKEFLSTGSILNMRYQAVLSLSHRVRFQRA